MFTLDRVVPWGRSFDEYCRMFALTGRDFTGKIAGCADGPASFNAEGTRRGARIVSCDPLYRFDAVQIRTQIEATSNRILEETKRNQDGFVWSSEIPSVEALGRVRLSAMNVFLDDYEAGRTDGRYLDAELPVLPLADHECRLAVCSHFLFLYTDQLGAAFHLDAIREMCRIAAEVRIFPLLALDGRQSTLVGEILSTFRAAGFEVSIERVDYEFQRGGDEMMRICRRSTTPLPSSIVSA